jgi:transcriptional regulator with XRE-family HTH domain
MVQTDIPIATDPVMSARASLKADFADRLRTAIERKGWTMSETARRASHFLNDGDKFGRAHVWHYVQGKALPRTKYLEALSQALDVRPDELMPAEIGADHPEPGAREEQLVVAPPAAARDGGSESADGMVHVRDYGDGTALLEVSQRVSWETAITVLRMLKAPTEA